MRPRRRPVPAPDRPPRRRSTAAVSSRGLLRFPRKDAIGDLVRQRGAGLIERLTRRRGFGGDLLPSLFHRRPATLVRGGGLGRLILHPFLTGLFLLLIDLRASIAKFRLVLLCFAVCDGQAMLGGAARSRGQIVPL